MNIQVCIGRIHRVEHAADNARRCSFNKKRSAEEAMGVENVFKPDNGSSPLPPSLQLLLHEWRIHAIARPCLASLFACSHVHVHCKLLFASPSATRGCALPCTHTGPPVASCVATFVHPPSSSFVRPLHRHADTSRACTMSRLRRHVCLS